MTVSLALRNHPSLPAHTRERIQRLAQDQGYRPDPVLTHLMQHLRNQRAPIPTGNLTALTTLDAGFVRRLLAGARARAAHLGYDLDLINIAPYLRRNSTLTRILRARGIAGVLLAPTIDPISYRRLLDWTQFATVAMTYSVVEPRLHRVVTHHFDNAVRTFDLLAARGYRRPALAMTTDMEFRANHSYSAAYYRAAQLQGIRPAPMLLVDRHGPADIRAWFRRYRPDAVVVANAHQVRDYLFPALGERGCAAVAFVCLDYEPDVGISGMDQSFEIIGSHAVDLVVGQIHRNERGLPENPTVSMVEGRWVDVVGKSGTSADAHVSSAVPMECACRRSLTTRRVRPLNVAGLQS